MNEHTDTSRRAGYTVTSRIDQTGSDDVVTGKPPVSGAIRSKPDGETKKRVKTEAKKAKRVVRSPTKAGSRRHTPTHSRQGLKTPADDPLSVDRVTYLLTVFTSKRLAGWLGVSPSQTSRWSQGYERPGPAVAPALIDLEHVYARARLVWGEEAAGIWLDSPNSFLDGARPLDVLYIDGPGRVLESLDAEIWGGAA
ncbi:MbcA/ParS/Xre antitoxin family protein [Rhodococcoides yunnanense]|uniref:MbcA/ParS/Xre antitoxin family protein n=1 Tax=Rhodococcoides yunnanense TaxID=278209 RepID=UPI000A06154C|nr:MbcA/ParS/Xre antitoxin family protein [Rhodococcus yunnanensis]